MDKNDNRHGSLSEQAYRLIRDRILQGRFPMGTPISRRKLALQFGMSLLPVSEAILRLQHDGLVESRPRAGTRVRIPAPHEIRDLYIIREALESQSARLFAEKASARERRELREMAENLDAKLGQCRNKGADPKIIYHAFDYHLSFHLRIAECTGSIALRNAIEKNNILIYNWILDIASQFPIRMPAHYHRNVIDVIAGPDPEAADAAMRQHVRSGLKETLAAAASILEPGVGRFKASRASHSVSQSNSAAEGTWRHKARSSSEIRFPDLTFCRPLVVASRMLGL
jgi:DNA-binding GntR family transcriptional regulator